MATFLKKVENFTCGHCGHPVVGNGYTNHCPRCLWGRHVDVHPGDRASECGGMMEPIGLVTKRGEERIRHRCVRCGFTGENRTDDADDREAIITIMRRTADRQNRETA